MEFISNLLLGAAAIGAGFYCFILSRRLRALATLEGGMGSAIAVLSSQVDELSGALKSAQDLATQTSGRLHEQTLRAEAAANKLELLVASMHDLPTSSSTPPTQHQEHTPWPRTEVEQRPSVPDPKPSGVQPKARILRRRPQQGVSS